MRGLLAGLLVALLVSAVALLVAAVGALGVAAIGALLHRWFELTQWQGSLIALAVTLGLGYLVYKLVAQTPTVPTWPSEWDDWEENAEGEDDEEDHAADAGVAQAEPPIVPWRRNRPTPGNLSPEKPATGRGKRK